MATPINSPSSFTTGEVAPALFGQANLTRTHAGAATMRNLFPRITGGAYSRAGSKFIGYSKQVGRSYPPRVIPFQFSVTQGRILEFGNGYMRVIANGGYITDDSLALAAATNTNPLTVTLPSSGAGTVMPINTGVYSSYAPGEVVTLAGGTFGQPAQVTVNDTELLSVVPQSGVGSGYVPTNTITLAGGTPSTKAILLVATTTVTTATVVGAGSGGTDGVGTVTGTTGVGTKFTAIVQITSGAIVGVVSISGGSYTTNPSNTAAEPVTGAGLSGATLAISMGVGTITVSNAGVYTANPPGGNFTQDSTSGSGTGALFGSALMGVQAASITYAGSYSVDPTNPVSQSSSTGTGLGVQFTMTWGAATALSVGDWVEFAGVGGMIQLNGATIVVAGVTGGDVYSFNDVFGNPVDATTWGTYTSGGVGSRIYTVASPYAEQDLRWLKFTQSADVLSICCVNQTTGTEYPPYDLLRYSDTSWVFQAVTFSPTVAAPGSCWLAASFNWANLFFSDPTQFQPVTANYAYVVTAVNPVDGTESVASPIGGINGQVDISADAGTITVNWSPVGGVSQYNVYKAEPVSSWGFWPPAIPVGSLFGFAGSSLGTSFGDSNIVPDLTQTPPQHTNPFARGAIIAATSTNGGGGYTHANVNISSGSGSGAIIEAVINNGGGQYNAPGYVSGYIILDGGQNYRSTDTFTVSGDGSGATGTLTIGPLSGTYPSVVSYFQQRRVYSNSINDPDTYWMSQVGSYTNFDIRIPTIDSDAITGTPWTQAVNGIQAFIQMPGGLVTLTGSSAWQLGGNGSSSFNPQPITPSSQQAQPQAFNGCSPFVPPIRISENNDIIYVNAKGNLYYALTYQYFTNIYTGKDITVISPHLFINYQIYEHAWCQDPYNLLWVVRNDGVLLSMTYYKPEEVTGWARHDTYGNFVSVASITELPIDALYLAASRPIGPSGEWTYTIERMDDRLWTSAEQVWAVDCALQYPMPSPNATLTVSTPSGQGTIAGITGLINGQGYGPNTTATIIDNNGLGSGSGAIAALTISGGQIASIATTPGSGYTYPSLVIYDPSGQGVGASAMLMLSTQATFTASAGEFSSGSVGDVIRGGGGVATINGYVSSTVVTGNYTFPVVALSPELGNQVPPIQSGSWTLTTPIQVVSGLDHLAGQTITGLADGFVITPRIVSSTGTVSLDFPATYITIGLGFTAQLQSVYLDVGDPTVQGQRKKIGAVTARLEASSGNIQGGANQIDGSTLTPMQLAAPWTNLTAFPNPMQAPYVGGAQPLFTGDIRVPVQQGIAKPGQVAFQQTDPLPLNILALIPEALEGDVPEQRAQQKQQRR